MNRSASITAPCANAWSRSTGRTLSDHVLILGLGNPLAEDDGLGVFALDILRMNYRFDPQVTLVDGGTLGLELIASVCRASYVIVLDAYRNRERAGKVSVISFDRLVVASAARNSAHDWGLIDILMAAELLGNRPAGVLVGVEPANLDAGKWGLSRLVCKALPTLLEAVLGELSFIGVTARTESLQELPRPRW